MDPSNFIICLTGLPASGKTTFSIKLKKVLERELKNLKVKIVDPDTIRKNLTTNEFNHNIEPLVRQKNLNLINEGVKKGFTIICDDLNYYVSMRHDIKKIADDFKVNFFIIHISTPLEICLKWNNDRGKPIPNKVIKQIQNKFDKFGKYGWDHPEASYNLSQIRNLDNEIEELVSFLLKQVNSSFEISKFDSILQTSSRLYNHNLDKATRNYVGKLLKDPLLFSFKKKILEARKLFIKLNKHRLIEGETEIMKVFKDWLKKSQDIKISDEFM